MFHLHEHSKTLHSNTPRSSSMGEALPPARQPLSSLSNSLSTTQPRAKQGPPYTKLESATATADERRSALSERAVLETITLKGTSSPHRLELIEIIGEGGFGCVYRGRDSLFGEVAVKVCEHSGDSADLKEIQREVSAHKRLQDKEPGYSQMFVRLHCCITQALRSLLVLEMVHGVELNVYVGEQKLGRLGESEARSIAKPFLEAIEFMHRKGVAHLDIKPSNILCAREIQSLEISHWH